MNDIIKIKIDAGTKLSLSQPPPKKKQIKEKARRFKSKQKREGLIPWPLAS